MTEERDRSVLKLNDLTQVPLGHLLKTPEGRQKLQRAHLGLTKKHFMYEIFSCLKRLNLVSDQDYYYDNVFFLFADFCLFVGYLDIFVDVVLEGIQLMLTGGFFSLAAWGKIVLSLFTFSIVYLSLISLLACVFYAFSCGFSEVVNLFVSDVNPLMTYLKNIPSDVEEVDLQDNALGVLPVEDLRNLLRTIPATVKRINLKGNGLFQGCNDEEEKQLISALALNNDRRFVFS